jgi:hypothetical protein
VARGGKLSSPDVPALEALLASLNQGRPVPPELPEAAAALRPLLAFQAEMQRQGREELFAGVKAVFAAELENRMSNTR